MAFEIINLLTYLLTYSYSVSGEKETENIFHVTLL